MNINVSSLCLDYLNQNMEDKKVYDLIFKKCHEDSHIVMCDDIEEELSYTYRHSLHSTRGNLIEYVLKKYIHRDPRFTVLNSKTSGNIQIRLPKSIIDEISKILSDYRCRRIDLRDDKTYSKVIRELFELANNTMKVDMVVVETQIDLLFKEKNNSKYYYYELKSRDNHDFKSDMGTLNSFLMIYCYLIMEYRITNFEDLNIGIVYVLEDSSLIVKRLSMGHNGGLSFKEFCERFYTVETSNEILSIIQKSLRNELDCRKDYFHKVAEVYRQRFKGKDFTKRQLMSAVENYTFVE